MKIIQKSVFLLVSLCLFFNATIAKTFSIESKKITHKGFLPLEIKKVEKSNILIDFDLENSAEPASEEESDSDEIQFDLVLYRPFEYSFEFLDISHLKKRYDSNQLNSCKLPLFIRYQNFRL